MIDLELDLNYEKLILNLPKHSRILDLGCGDGRMIRYLTERGYCNISGVDHSPNVLNIKLISPRARLECVDVGPEWFKAHQNKYDLIIMRQMIYYIDRSDIVVFLREMRRILNPNAMVVVEIFNGNLVTSKFVYAKDPFIKTTYNEYSLRRLFDSTGYRAMEIYEAKTPYKFKARTILYRIARALWILKLRLIYFVERGFSERPTMYSNSIIAIFKI